MAAPIKICITMTPLPLPIALYVMKAWDEVENQKRKNEASHNPLMLHKFNILVAKPIFNHFIGNHS